MSTNHEKGWGMRIGGPRPYLAWGVFTPNRQEAQIKCYQPYHKPVRVVMLTEHEYRKLTKKGTP